MFSDILLEITKLLAEDQPILDEHGNLGDVKKPAIMKSQSIILTDDELKELGMKVLSDENVINSEIVEEDEDDVNGECDEKPIQNEAEEIDLKNDKIDTEELNLETEIDDSNKENEPENQDNNDGIEENKDELNQNANTEAECIHENESKENSLVTDNNSDIGTVDVEAVNEIPMETAKPIETKQKQTRPISGHKFKIPPMWTPGNPRANAAFVYVFFRHVSVY